MNFSKILIYLKQKLLGAELPGYFYKKTYSKGDHPNIYVNMLGDYKNWIYVEEEALKLKGNWKSIFENKEAPLDLEIGCGNGTFFEHVVSTNTSRNFIGIEYKYKPLVQTIRRIKKLGCSNGRGLRFNAKNIDDIFISGEISNAYIYFPDPWPKRKHEKNRLVRAEFLNKLFKIQRVDTFLDFKTDSMSYFDFVCEEIKKTPYKQVRYSRDLHKSEWANQNFVTQFENIFTRQGLPTYYLRLEK